MCVTSPLSELAHIRYMRPRCRVMPCNIFCSSLSVLCSPLPDIGYPDDQASADMILFVSLVVFLSFGCLANFLKMPYLHYEKTEARDQMAKVIAQVRGGGRSWPSRSNENKPHENSLWAYLKRDIPLHVRRTLDQFFYDAFDSDKSKMTDVPARNQDQVTQRFMRARNEWKAEVRFSSAVVFDSRHHTAPNSILSSIHFPHISPASFHESDIRYQ